MMIYFENIIFSLLNILVRTNPPARVTAILLIKVIVRLTEEYSKEKIPLIH